MSQTSHTTTPIDSQPSQTTGPAVPVSPEQLSPESLSPGIRQTRLLERAIRERWPISDGMKKAIMTRQCNIAINPQSSPREATSAARAVLSAVSHNLEITKMEIAEEAKAAGEDVNKHLHVHVDGQGQVGYRPPIRNVFVHRPRIAGATGDGGEGDVAPVETQ